MEVNKILINKAYKFCTYPNQTPTIREISWSHSRCMLEYKTKWYGKQAIVRNVFTSKISFSFPQMTTNSPFVYSTLPISPFGSKILTICFTDITCFCLCRYLSACL